MSIKNRVTKFLEVFEEILNISEKFSTLVLADGTEVSYEGELEVGTALKIKGVNEQGEEIETALMEGTYELGGDMAGKTITVDANGVVVEIGEVQAQGAEMSEDFTQAMKEIATSMATKFKSIQDENVKLKNKIKELEEKQKDAFEKINDYFESGKKTKIKTESKTAKLF